VARGSARLAFEVDAHSFERAKFGPQPCRQRVYAVVFRRGRLRASQSRDVVELCGLVSVQRRGHETATANGSFCSHELRARQVTGNVAPATTLSQALQNIDRGARDQPSVAITVQPK
jgi:hypothetical protein